MARQQATRKVTTPLPELVPALAAARIARLLELTQGWSHEQATDLIRRLLAAEAEREAMRAQTKVTTA